MNVNEFPFILILYINYKKKYGLITLSVCLKGSRLSFGFSIIHVHTKPREVQISSTMYIMLVIMNQVKVGNLVKDLFGNLPDY